MNRLKSIFFILPIALMSLSLSANDLLDPFTGTWTFTSPSAPIEYSKGDFVVTKGGSDYYVEIKFENESIQATDVSAKGNTLSFKVAVDGTEVPVVLKVKGNEMEGYSDTADGKIEIKATRKF